MDKDNKLLQIIKQSNFQMSCIGIGLGGSNVARAIAKKFNCSEYWSLNTSKQDDNAQDIQDINVNFINIGEMSGAGKNTDNGKAILKKNIMGLLKNENFIKRALTPFTKVTFVCYSLAGGTGSGVGPVLSKILTEKYGVLETVVFGSDQRESSLPYRRSYNDSVTDDIDSKKVSLYFDEEIKHSPGIHPDHFVIQVPILPSTGESGSSFINVLKSMDTIKQIQTENTNIPTFFVDNKDVSIRNSHIDYKESLNTINNEVAEIFHRYFQRYGHSSFGSLDPNDRLRFIRFGGIHVICRLQEIGSYSNKNNISSQNSEKIDVDLSIDKQLKKLEIVSPFYIPNGSTFQAMAFEVKEKYSKIAIDLMNKFSVKYTEPVPGFINGENGSSIELYDIIHYSCSPAFYSIITIYERLLEETNNAIRQSRDREITKVVDDDSRIKEFAMWGDSKVKKNEEPKKESNLSDIQSLLD